MDHRSSLARLLMLAKFKQWLHSRRNTAQKSAPVFSGIALLPSETLGGEIFPLVVHGEFRDYLWHRKLLALAGVCTQWMNIVHSTPLLWNQCICINTRQFSRVGRFREERIVKKYFEAVRMCLTRSAPLRVSVSIDWFDLRGDRKDFACIVDMISDAAVRIESLRTSIVGMDDIGVGILRALERLPTGTLRALTTIDISFQTYTTPHIDLMNAPHLRRVELSMGWNPINVISIPWLQLTHVTLTAPPFACLAVLARCCNLVSAVLHHMHTSLPDAAPLITATLMHLTSLRLSVSSQLIRAVGNLVLPALTTLELSYFDMVWPQPAVFSHLPLGNVQRLTLTMHSMVQLADLCALLRCTPGVTELKLLTPYDVENTFLDALRTDIPSTELLLPQLEMLRIHGGPIFSRHGSRSNSQVIVAFQAMIASRVSTGLRRLVYSPPNLGHNSQLRDELMLAVAAFSLNGLHVEVL